MKTVKDARILCHDDLYGEIYECLSQWEEEVSFNDMDPFLNGAIALYQMIAEDNGTKFVSGLISEDTQLSARAEAALLELENVKEELLSKWR